MAGFKKIVIPEDSAAVGFEKGHFVTPPHPIVPYIEGDGAGPAIWQAARRVIDAAVAKAYSAQRSIAWMEIFAGDKAQELYRQLLPDETLAAIRQFKIALKGPLAKPTKSGVRSLNVTLRHVLDLFAHVRQVRWYSGVPSPVQRPEKLNVVIFRENTEDIYAGIEWPKGSREAQDLISFLSNRYGIVVAPDSGIGIKAISETCSRRLVREAVKYALKNHRKKVTLVHLGNHMKYTEGGFCDWGYSVAREEFDSRVITGKEVVEKYGAWLPEGKVMINDHNADTIFQRLLLHPEEFDVIAAPFLSGDFLIDACAAQVGGLDMAPGGNIGEEMGVFGAGQVADPAGNEPDLANPLPLILSGVLMLRYMGWPEAADLIEAALAMTVQQKKTTAELGKQIEGATCLKTSEFADAIIENI